MQVIHGHVSKGTIQRVMKETRRVHKLFNVTEDLFIINTRVKAIPLLIIQCNLYSALPLYKSKCKELNCKLALHKFSLIVAT